MAEAAFECDAASVLFQGKRETQQDAIVADFPIGMGSGLVVLADGMGGHEAGEVASNIVVTEVFSELKLKYKKLAAEGADIPAILRNSAKLANDCLRRLVELRPETNSMGTTLVAVFQCADELHWISIGDSLLYLYRDGELRRLNADHSLAPQIDRLVENGVIAKETADHHPQRQVLTSALTGNPISEIDCPDKPIKLLAGDVIIVASDGLDFLSRPEIEAILTENLTQPSAEIAKALLASISERDAPDQDNFGCSVVKATDPRLSHRPANPNLATARFGNFSGRRSSRLTLSTPMMAAARPQFLHRLKQMAGGLF